jgi:polysaccharide pyruvyl transferase WcaK-like protein
MNIIITGYYKKDNFGDDLFELIADKLFQSDKFKKQICNYEIIPINNLLKKCKENNKNDNIIPDCIILFGGETLNDYFLDNLIRVYEYYKNINELNKSINKSINKLNNKNNSNIKISNTKISNTKISNNYKNCVFKAFSVSCNQEYNANLINKIQLFDTIFFRSMKDYNYFKYKMILSNSMTICEYVPDIAFSLNFDKILSLPNTNKYVGFFLSQTAYSNLNEKEKNSYILTLTKYVTYCLKQNYKIKIFSMCMNEIESENDNIINNILYNHLCNILLKNDINSIKYYKSNKDILNKFSKLSFAVCWRYHAHILSIIHNVPFISISETPKVIDLLQTNNLNYFKACPDTFEEKVDYLIKNTTIIKKTIKKIYKINNKLTHNYLNPLIYISNNKFNSTFYINDNEINIIIDYIISNYVSKRSTILNSLDKANYIIFLLMRNINNEYTYGLESKINDGLDNSLEKFKDDIKWLIEDCIIKNNIMFYESAKNIISLNINMNPNSMVNIKFISQDDYNGLHRSGWSYVINSLNKYNDSNKIICDLYLDRTFHWKCEDLHKLNIIPYTKPWIGFIHHTLENKHSENNTINLFNNPHFITSLMNCNALYVLSVSLKEKVMELIKKVTLNNKYILSIPVYSLTHPTETVSNDKLFTMDKFISNNCKHIIQIGAWMRNLNAINILDINVNNINNINNLKLIKTVLKGKEMESYYEVFDKSCAQTDETSKDSHTESRELEGTNGSFVMCRDKNTKSVKLNDDIKVITYLENCNYDLLLMQNIVFINLIDASAVNTIIECIVRNTPIFVNRLPATEEALGISYPLFYNEISEVTNMLNMNKITEGYNYLSKMNKDKFKIETFINDFKKTLVNM